MANFNYIREEITLDAYDKTYRIPTRTPDFLSELSKIQTALSATSEPIEQASLLKSGIALFITEDEADRIFPDINKVDTDELTAFWWTLSDLMSVATNNLFTKYSPNQKIRKSK